MLLYVCLLKAYLEEGGVRKLVAVDVAFIQSEEGGLRLKSVEQGGDVFLKNVELLMLDALNSVVILKPKRS